MFTIEKNFKAMGARLRITEFPVVLRRGHRHITSFRFDIERDKKETLFRIDHTPKAHMIVLDIQPKDRHLLLMVDVDPVEGRTDPARSKFLCGHDERDWFIARVPNDQPVSTVLEAKESLKPQLVRDAQQLVCLANKSKNRRHNKVFVRQGEWFFIPAPQVNPPAWWVLHDESLIRGRGKPHRAEHLVRIGGDTVYSCWEYRGERNVNFTQSEYKKLYATIPRDEFNALRFTARVRDPEVYVKGRITHRDHKTVHLDGWHRVLPNTESAIDSRGNVITLDFID